MMTWLLGLIGWGGAAALLLAVLVFGWVASKKVFLILGAAIAVALLAWGVRGYAQASTWQAKHSTVIRAHQKTSAAFTAYQQQVADHAAAEQLARNQREDAHRDRENQITADAQARADAARLAADRVRADAQRLREQAVKLAAGAAQDRRAVEAVTTAGQRAADQGRTPVLADVLGRCATDLGELAVIADRARSAGQECEARYDSAVVLTGGAP